MMGSLGDFALKAWFIANWKACLAFSLAFLLVFCFYKWVGSFDEDGGISTQEKIQSIGFAFVAVFVLTALIYILL